MGCWAREVSRHDERRALELVIGIALGADQSTARRNFEETGEGRFQGEDLV